MKPPWVKFALVALYSVICGAEFLVQWAKEKVAAQIKGKPEEKP